MSDVAEGTNCLIIPNNYFRGNDVLTIRVANSMGNRIADLERKGVHWQKFYNINVSPRRPENRRNFVRQFANVLIFSLSLHLIIMHPFNDSWLSIHIHDGFLRLTDVYKILHIINY